MARCPSNNDYHDRHRAEHTVATYVARYRCFVGSGDVLSRLVSAATGTKINIRDRITLDYIRKYGLDADIAIFILKYQYLLPYKHPISGAGVRNPRVAIFAADGHPRVEECALMYAPQPP